MTHAVTFSYKEALRYGWRTTLKNFWFFLGIMAVTFGLDYVLGLIQDSIFREENAVTGIALVIFALIRWIISLEISIATIAIILKIVDKSKTDFYDLFSFFKADLLLRYFLLSALYGVIVILGTIFFIIPGIYFGIKYGFAPYIFIDKKTGIWEAFKLSAKLTQGIKWKLFWFQALMILIIIAGALALLIGLFFAYPTAFLAEVYVYRKLTHHHLKAS